MSAASMWTAMQAAIAAVTPYQGSDPVASAAYRAAVGEAMCTAIVSESPAATFRNRIINGDMSVSQVNGGTAVTPTTAGYVTDMWNASLNSGGVNCISAQQVVDAPPGFKYSTKFTVTNQHAPGVGEPFYFQQPIEGQNIIDFGFGTASPKTIATGQWIKGSVPGVYSVSIRSGTADYSYIGTVNVTTSWTQAVITIVGTSSGTWPTDNTTGMQWALDLGSGSNFNTTAGSWQAGNYFNTTGSVTFVNQVAGSTLNITGVQLEKVPTGATTGTDFEFLPDDVVLMRCQRYLQPLGIAGNEAPIGIGFGIGSGAVVTQSEFNPPMRTAPTVSIIGSAASIYMTTASIAAYASSGITAVIASPTGCNYQLSGPTTFPIYSCAHIRSAAVGTAILADARL